MWNAKLAHWPLAGHGTPILGLAMGHDLKAALLPLGPLCAQVSPSGLRVDLAGCESGARGWAMDPQRCGGSVWEYRLDTSKDGQVRMPEPLPLFEFMPVDVSLGEASAVIHLPSAHLLPWPSRRSFKAVKDPEAMAQDALNSRVQSAVASGLKNLTSNPIPSHVREYLAPGAWLEARRVAMILSGAPA